MKKTLTTTALAGLLTLTGCGATEAESNDDTEPTAQNTPTPEVDTRLFEGHNSVALLYRWVKPDDSVLGVELTGWYTYDVGTPTGDGEVESNENYHGGFRDDEVLYPPSSVRDFVSTYISVPDGDRLWAQGRITEDNAPEGAGLECLIVSLDNGEILAHEESDYYSKPVVCEVAF